MTVSYSLLLARARYQNMLNVRSWTAIVSSARNQKVVRYYLIHDHEY